MRGVRRVRGAVRYVPRVHLGDLRGGSTAHSSAPYSFWHLCRMSTRTTSMPSWMHSLTHTQCHHAASRSTLQLQKGRH